MSHTLYVTDMDGTLLDNSSQVSPESRQIISDLSRRGALITVATARTPATVVPLLAGTVTRCPAIVMTGAALWDRENGCLVDPVIIAPGQSRAIIEMFHQAGINPFVYTVTTPSRLDVYHAVEMNRHERAFWEERRNLRLKKFHIGVNPPSEALDRVILVYAIGDAAAIEPLAESLRRAGGCSVSCYPDMHSRDVALIEVFAPGVSKAAAVERLAQSVGADRTVVFGDNLNDLPMMEVATLAVAVENAFEEVKEAADIVIGPNSASSVARFIQEDYEHI